jgi:S-adenosylmethionine-dependent methyltransferase
VAGRPGWYVCAVIPARDGVGGDGAGDSTFGGARPEWLGRLGNVRNVVRQEMISRQLARHMGTHPARVLDVGAGQGTQSIRLARAGHQVLAVEPDSEMRAAFRYALDAETSQVRDRVTLREGSAGSLGAVTGGETFDVVLLMGVLMYLPASPPVLAELAAHVAPGGLAALAIRTTTSALWRPAARQDWQAALAAFGQAGRRRERETMRPCAASGSASRSPRIPAGTP